MNSLSWQLKMLGPLHLEGPDGETVRPERKTAALLAYLALEGPSHRARLVGLLWPDTREAAARNNLVHLLRKLRTAIGTELVEGGELLSLLPLREVDALIARDLFAQGRYAEVAAFEGTLLDGLPYDDLPELDDWVSSERECFEAWRLQALQGEAAQLERAGNYDEAVVWARRLLDADPFSESAYRRLMRLQYLRGDRPAALKAFERCKAMLQHEFGVEALPETVRLAQEIERGTVPPPSPTAPSPSIPLAVLRPPTLVGREVEWTRLEAARAAGQVAFISGEPGVGKSRLARDFAFREGALLFEGRPGDLTQPYASLARGLRAFLSHRSDLALLPWVRHELSRLLPEFAEPGVITSPLRDDADVLRFKGAVLEFIHKGAEGVPVLLIDDLHYYDAASSEVVSYLISAGSPFGESGQLPFPICTFRPGELTPAQQTDVQRTLGAGLGILLELEPLPGAAVAELLQKAGVPDDYELHAALVRYAGGNPLFVLETLKHLVESGGLKADLLKHLPPSGKVGVLLRQRLDRLSPPALGAARAAAVLQSDFDLEVIAEILNAPIFELARAWEELETAQVMREGRFSHDLMMEAVRADIPVSVRGLLHRSAARTLERHRATPGRVARHWLEGDKPDLAAPLLLEAARDARAQLRLVEAAAFYAEAAGIYDALHDQAAAFGALAAQAETLATLENVDAHDEVSAQLLARAVTSSQAARAQVQACWSASQRGEVDALERAAHLGLDRAAEAGDLHAEADLQHYLMEVAVLRGHPDNARGPLERMREIGERLSDPSRQALAHENLGFVAAYERRHEAAAHFDEAERLYLGLGDLPNATYAANRRGQVEFELGNVDRALTIFERANSYLQDATSSPTVKLITLYRLSLCEGALEHFDQALTHVERGLALGAPLESGWQDALRLHQAYLLLELGEFEAALEGAKAALEAPYFPANNRPVALRTVGAALAALGRKEEALARYDEADVLLASTRNAYRRATLMLLRAALQPPDARLETLGNARDLGMRCDLRGVVVAAEVRLQGAQLELSHVPSITREGEAIDAAGVIPTGEVLLTRARVAAALGQAEAADLLRAAQAWVWRTAEQHVRQEHREAFLTRHPTCRAILETTAALEAGAPS
jgi:DNA-binding SARP family transcriptional activator